MNIFFSYRRSAISVYFRDCIHNLVLAIEGQIFFWGLTYVMKAISQNGLDQILRTHGV